MRAFGWVVVLGLREVGLWREVEMKRVEYFTYSTFVNRNSFYLPSESREISVITFMCFVAFQDDENATVIS